jgi:hypothetical protein
MARRRCEIITVITAEPLRRKEKILCFLTSAPLRLSGENDSGDLLTASDGHGTLPDAGGRHAAVKLAGQPFV